LGRTEETKNSFTTTGKGKRRTGNIEDSTK